MHRLVAMTCPEAANLDLGRPLRYRDISNELVQPIDESESGSVRCYHCKDGVWDESVVPPLTCSSGVFTLLVQCDMQAPVYLCLEHIPFRDNQFEVFTPEVAAALRDAKAGRDTLTRAVAS